MYEPIQNKSNYQHIVGQIKSMILTGELKVGDRLPSERDLSEMFNVSRPSVREALKALEAIGLLESRHGGGNYIVNHLRENMADSLSLVFVMDQCKLEDLTQLRHAVEAESLRSIARDNDPAVYERLHQLMVQVFEAETLDEIAQCDLAFHSLIASLSKNPLLHYVESTIHTAYLNSVEFLNRNYYACWDSLEIAREYQLDILKALDTRDPQKIDRALTYHYQESYQVDGLYDGYIDRQRKKLSEAPPKPSK